ncbi:hypothetical protein J2W57_000019 [Chryseobacterium ginsenosidimutans]|uniref:Uncharacterized protein n=1 Tax=Chryseobacterium geocarposphaerae TaxID=1416776 RepID=A0ABU1L913_9FLAO|nr:hypothetical protein [Chryseobacterium geocarposphaerae]MDR6696670.1 hypothetical protein [Chryseobacterium ginsenosidimutans]
MFELFFTFTKPLNNKYSKHEKNSIIYCNNYFSFSVPT